MDIQHFLQGLGFYLLPSLLVALIPTGVIIFTTLMIKTFSNWKPIILCLFAGIFMWCYLAYWSMQGFLIFPLGVDASTSLTIPFVLIGGIVAGITVYSGANHYRKNRNLSGLFLIAIGYLAFVLLAFSILNSRGAS
jgi:hypothetical protein